MQLSGVSQSSMQRRHPLQRRRSGPGLPQRAALSWQASLGRLVSFCRHLDLTGDLPPVRLNEVFEVFLCRKSAPNLAELNGLQLVQVEFAGSAVPWRLDGATVIA